MTSEADMELALDRFLSPAELRPASRAEVMAQETFGSKLARCRELFGKPFHQLALATQSALILRRLQQMVCTLRLSPLWDERIRASGIADIPRDFEEWQQLPIADRETLNAFYMGERPGLVIPLDRGGFEIIASGGTSGGLPIETVYSQRELHDTYALAGQFLGTFVLPRHLHGEGPRWIVTTLCDYEMWSSGTMIGGLLQRTPGVNFIAAGPMGERVYHHIMSFPGPKAIMGMSREIEGLIPLGEKLPQAARASFQLAIYGSGILPTKKIQELKALYPSLQILSYFASNQAEAIGMQLSPGAFLTAVPGLHLIEIVDGNGRWVQPGEEGELVVTRLHATEAPVLRMQLGDRMIRRPDYLSDALNAEQMEFAGRSSDILHLGESHYAAKPTFAAICEALRRAGFDDLDQLAHAIQLQNNRKEKVLSLVTAVDHPDRYTARLRERFTDAEIRGFFIEALKGALSLFDQTQAQFRALEQTPYRFEVRFVDQDSALIYRTRVNKVPLIRDIL